MNLSQSNKSTQRNDIYNQNENTDMIFGETAELYNLRVNFSKETGACFNTNIVTQNLANSTSNSVEGIGNMWPDDTIKMVKEMMNASKVQSPYSSFDHTNNDFLKPHPKTVKGICFVCFIISFLIEESSGRSENEFSSSNNFAILDNFIKEEDQKQITTTDREILGALFKNSNSISKESIATKMKVMKNEEANQWKIFKKRKRRKMLNNLQVNASASNRDIYEEYK